MRAIGAIEAVREDAAFEIAAKCPLDMGRRCFTAFTGGKFQPGFEVKASSAEPVKVARALEDTRHDGGVGEVWMRAEDHQIIMPLYVSTFVEAGTVDVKHDADDTGYGWHSDVRIEAKDSVLPTICRMERP